MEGQLFLCLIYFFAGLTGFIIGVLVEKQANKPLKNRLFELTEDYYDLKNELYFKTLKSINESSEFSNLKAENQTLIKKNKSLKNTIRQIKKNNKKLKKENNDLMQTLVNPIERYTAEINNLQKIIVCKEEILNELKNKHRRIE